MNNILTILKNRRVWAGVFGALAFILPLVGVKVNFNVETITDLVIEVVELLLPLISAILALWSYVKPKK